MQDSWHQVGGPLRRVGHLSRAEGFDGHQLGAHLAAKCPPRSPTQGATWRHLLPRFLRLRKGCYYCLPCARNPRPRFTLVAEPLSLGRRLLSSYPHYRQPRCSCAGCWAALRPPCAPCSAKDIKTSVIPLALSLSHAIAALPPPPHYHPFLFRCLGLCRLFNIKAPSMQSHFDPSLLQTFLSMDHFTQMYQPAQHFRSTPFSSASDIHSHGTPPPASFICPQDVSKSEMSDASDIMTVTSLAQQSLGDCSGLSKKKRKSWGQVLPKPTTNLPPRKRAKTEEEKAQRKYERVQRNRHAAHMSRMRKQDEMENLKHENDVLKQDNESLNQEISRLREELSHRQSGKGLSALPATFDSFATPELTTSPSDKSVEFDGAQTPPSLFPDDPHFATDMKQSSDSHSAAMCSQQWMLGSPIMRSIKVEDRT